MKARPCFDRVNRPPRLAPTFFAVPSDPIGHDRAPPRTTACTVRREQLQATRPHPPPTASLPSLVSLLSPPTSHLISPKPAIKACSNPELHQSKELPTYVRPASSPFLSCIPSVICTYLVSDPLLLRRNLPPNRAAKRVFTTYKARKARHLPSNRAVKRVFTTHKARKARRSIPFRALLVSPRPRRVCCFYSGCGSWLLPRHVPSSSGEFILGSSSLVASVANKTSVFV